MKILLNIIWLIFGGLISAVGYVAASIPLFVSIIGIPFGLQTLKLALVALWPLALIFIQMAGRRVVWPV